MKCLKDPSMYIENLKEALIKLNMFDNLPDAQKAQKASEVVWGIESDVIGELGKNYIFFFYKNVYNVCI